MAKRAGFLFIRVHQNFPRHARVQAIAPEHRGAALGLFVALICRSASLLTDGTLTAEDVENVAFELRVFEQRDELVKALLDAGLLVKSKGGFLIRDYLDYQSSREDVEEERRKNREYKRTQRTRSGPDSGLDSGLDDARTPDETTTGICPGSGTKDVDVDVETEKSYVGGNGFEQELAGLGLKPGQLKTIRAASRELVLAWVEASKAPNVSNPAAFIYSGVSRGQMPSTSGNGSTPVWEVCLFDSPTGFKVVEFDIETRARSYVARLMSQLAKEGAKPSLTERGKRFDIHYTPATSADEVGNDDIPF